MKIIKDYTLSYQLKKHPFSVGFYLLVVAATNAIEIICTLLTAQFIAEISTSNFAGAIYNFILLTATIILNSLLWNISQIIYHRFEAKAAVAIKKNIIKRCFSITSKVFSEKESGIFLSRIGNDSYKVINGVASVFTKIAGLFTEVFVIIYIIFINYIIGCMIIGTILILTAIEFFRVKVNAKNIKQEKEANEKSSSLTAEIIRSERDIKSLNLDRKLYETAEVNYNFAANKSLHRQYLNTFFQGIQNTVASLLIMAVILVGIVLMEDLVITFVSLMFIYTNRNSVRYLYHILGAMSDNIVDIKTSSNRIKELFNDSIFPSEIFGDKIVESVEGKIEFKRVSFSYVETPREDEPNKSSDSKSSDVKEVFAKLSFRIPANKTVAFVGRSGSGKTTILNLISKLYDVSSGEVLIDGINISDFNKTSIRRHVSLVNQFPYISNTSIRENLLMANSDATNEEIEEVCKKASLHEFIIKLKNGYDTKVGEGGIKLSGGERQRLAIARALLKKSKIILFDESTSSLDNETQENVKKSIATLGGNHTIVIVAHRLSTVKNADKIFFLEDGKITGSGTFKELFSKNDEFKKFFRQELED